MVDACYMQEVPKIPYDFLKELLDILGKPKEIYLRAWHEKRLEGMIVLEEGYAERICKCEVLGISGILALYYDRRMEKESREREKYSIEKLTWQKICFDKDNRYRGHNLEAEFTPYKFDLKINTKRVSQKKFNSLLNIIDKYKVDNNIKLIFSRDFEK